MNIHFIQHESYEAPGAYLKWAEKNGCNITFSKVYEHQPLPAQTDKIDLLIIMGGPQCPDTTIQEYSHFDANAEMKLILECIGAGKIVIGVCLGAQLIGQALGAKYEHSPEKETGNFPIQLTEEGMTDEKLSHFGKSLTVGHWHSDMPGLTPDCSILAKSEGCPRQIIKYSGLVYGIQCHMEFTKEVVELLIKNEPDLEAKNRKYKFVQGPLQILNFDYSEMNEMLYSFLNKLTKELKARM